MWLDVEVLCSRRRDVLAIEVEEVRATLGKRSMRPLLVVADRLDALPLALPRNEDLAGLLTSLRDMASASPPLVLFATAVSPAVVGPIIPQLEPTYVYFDWPTGERAEEFLHLAGWPRWIQFAQKIAGLAEKRKVHLTTGSLVNGLGELKRIVKDPEALLEMNDEECGKLALALCAPTPVTVVDGYKNQYDAYIGRALSAIRRLVS